MRSQELLKLKRFMINYDYISMHGVTVAELAVQVAYTCYICWSIMVTIKPLDKCHWSNSITVHGFKIILFISCNNIIQILPTALIKFTIKSNDKMIRGAMTCKCISTVGNDIFRRCSSFSIRWCYNSYIYPQSSIGDHYSISIEGSRKDFITTSKRWI